MKHFIVALIVLAVCCLIIQSCSAIGIKYRWDKDYYAYKMGAMINGVEYHEYAAKQLFLPQFNSCGFEMEDYGNLVLIHDCMEGFYSWWSVDEKRQYSWDICIIMEKDSFVPGMSFNFDGTGGYLEYWLGVIQRKEYDKFDSLPMICGSMRNLTGKIVDGRSLQISAPIVEGEITFGTFDGAGHNADVVTFNYRAQYDDGEELVVKDGYCYYYRVP